MPAKGGKYRRKYGRKRKGAKAWGHYGAQAGKMAYRAMKGVNFLRSLINVERKVYDIDGTSVTTVTNAGSVTWLSGITTGTGYNTRTGMIVKASGLSIRGTIENNSAATTPSQCRIIVFVNQSLNHGATPAVTDILQSAGASGIAGPYTPYNLDNVGDFKILMDKTYTVDNVQRNQASVNFYCRLGHHIRWDLAGDAITDTEIGHVFMLLISDQATNSPTFGYYSRLRFIDN